MTDITIYNGSLRLAASVYGPHDAPDLLFLHGISGSRDTWEESVRHLEDRYRIWTLDFRGHGHSDRAQSYLIADYASDAAAALETIGRPTVVVGHSLGGITAAALAQRPHPHLTAVFLEDPPIYLGEQTEWDKGIYATVFPLIREKQVGLQSSGAGLMDYVNFIADAPSAQGGVAADHRSRRALMSSGSGLQRQDPAAWAPVLDLTCFASLDTARPLQVPTMLIQADDALGAAFMAGHEERFMLANPAATIVQYAGATHSIHGSHATESRFFTDLDAFLARHTQT